MTCCAKGNLGLHHRNEEGTKEAYHRRCCLCCHHETPLFQPTREFQFPYTTYINTEVAWFLLLPPSPESSPAPVLEAYINNGRQQGPRPRRHAVSGSVRPRKAEHIVRSRFDRCAVCHEPSKQKRARRDTERGRSRQRWKALV